MLDGAEEIFLQQFKGLLQAGVGADLRIMVPMVSGLSEIRAAKAVMEKAKAELKAEGKPYTEDVQFGIMIEVPQQLDGGPAGEGSGLLQHWHE